MSLHCMPFLVVNYGAEMLFILEQRLQAQNVKGEKAIKVMADVTNALFLPDFVAELMRPQPLYTPAATRDIFNRLAHSSIMRLSEASMDKLYDLMTMGCKLQVMSCKHPRDLVDVTISHIESIKASVGTGKALEYINNTQTRLAELCQGLSDGELGEIRQQLCNFYQDKRVRVSIFLQDGLQNRDGSFVLARGLPARPLVAPLGTVQYFNTDEGGEYGRSNPGHPDSMLQCASSGDNNLGKNLYSRPRTTSNTSDGIGGQSPQPAAMMLDEQPHASPAPALGESPQQQPQYPTPADQQEQQTASARGVAQSAAFQQYNPAPKAAASSASPGAKFSAAALQGAGISNLSNFIVTGQAKEIVPINLFGGADEEMGAGPSGASSDNVLIINRPNAGGLNQELQQSVHGFDGQPQQQQQYQQGGAGDLLDLMDGM